MDSVIVTGASRGLGLGIARELADSGRRVIGIARRTSDAFEAAAGAVKSAGKGELVLRAFDLSDTDDIPLMVKALRAEFGSLQGLVNNAGIGTGGILSTMRDAQIAQLLSINVLSPIILTKYVVRALMAGGGGRIVNISSIVSFTGYSGLSAYAATKAALIGFTRALAREIGPLGITVNAVAPGFIDTEMTADMATDAKEKIMRRSALRRQAEVGDVAGAVAYLLSERARNITGTVLTVDAGSTA